MRFLWLIFVVLILAMVGLLPRLKSSEPKAAQEAAHVSHSAATDDSRLEAVFTSTREASELVGEASQRDSIVRYAMQQLGTNYCYAGNTPETGFDCSGFVQFVYSRFGIAMPHSTALLISVGQPVPRSDARPGDIVVFTGTDKAATTPGHAGIITTAGPSGPIRFVHSSSARRESGVKVSQVEGTDYERRFMQVRRVVGPGAPAVARTGPAARKASPVAALPTLPVAVEADDAPAAAPPKVLPRRKSVARKSTATVAKKKVVAQKKTVAKKKPAPTVRRKASAKSSAPVKKRATR
ncbi:C40 family peptidase [Hymenobacter arizonensis]|uniref:Cell wall-associated hydrolase, NlpC family n=1 Tax=Hymenobacter arizonensis TaxID=1227077 RepID=A0A1I5TQ11_HYMAR|nr:C40 family peptidase [Hymenobacter arizonensis]SFP85125.1 Cell wall-associated hydrolase, NlpC family [Hymenobacter arizonensis]